MSTAAQQQKYGSVLAQEAVDHYHGILRESQDVLDVAQKQWSKKLEDVRFVFGGRMLTPYLRPHFVAREQWDAVTAVCERLWASILKVGDAAVRDANLVDYLGLTDQEKRLIKTDPKFKGTSRLSRLDSFLTENAYQYVELNAETPAGVAYSDVAADLFLELDVMRRFTEKYNLSRMTSCDKLLAVLLAAYREFSGENRKPQIAIVDYKGLPTQREFELVRDYFEKNGYSTIICDPRELEFSNGRLKHGDFQIDLIYKRLLVNEFLEKLDECQALLQAYEAQAVCVVNSFRGKLLHKKHLFGVLTDEQFAGLFEPGEREFISKHVPWTRRFEERQTTFQGKEIDLVSYTRQNRRNFLLKPNDEYGGKGIFVGWQGSDQQWEEAIQTSLAGDYLVQERVGTPREVFPYITPQGKVEFIDQLVDLDPLLFDGKVGSAFTRLSVSELANVTAGGGLVPVFIVEGRK